MFPVGGMQKSAVKKLAHKIGLPNMDKKESMGLCFVGKIRLKDFLEQKLKPKKGKIVDGDGKVIGKHLGLFNYTLGQRQGVAVGGSGPYYVFKKDLKTNTLYVTNNPEDKRLEVLEVDLHSMNWIGFEPKPVNKLIGRYRHQGQLISLIVTKIGKDHYFVKFNKPQKAVASGQSLVLYKGKQCVGGGVIV